MSDQDRTGPELEITYTLPPLKPGRLPSDYWKGIAEKPSDTLSESGPSDHSREVPISGQWAAGRDSGPSGAEAKLAAIRRHIEDRAAAFNATTPLQVRPQDIRVSGAAILAIIDRPHACPAEVHNCPDNGGLPVMKDEDGDRVCAAGDPVCRYPLGEHESCPVHDRADTQQACPAGCPDWVCMCYEEGGREPCHRESGACAAPAGPDPLTAFRLHVTEDGEIHLACPEGYTPVACMWGRTVDPDPLGGVRATLGDLMAAAKTHTGKAAEEAHREWVRYLEQVETDLDGKGAGS